MSVLIELAQDARADERFYRAATNGWPCVIISDMLVLRNWTNPSVWKVEEAGPGQASAATPAQPDPSAIVSCDLLAV